MLEECGLPYNVIPVNIARGDQFTPAFLEISPNNRMPAIVDPDGPGGGPISVFESGRKTGKFYPTADRARVEVTNACSAEGEAIQDRLGSMRRSGLVRRLRFSQ
jgi:glutathione S-transferase